MIKPGDKIEIDAAECKGCGAPAYQATATLLFESKEHDLWLAKLDNENFYLVVSIEPETGKAIVQQCGTVSDLQHMAAGEEHEE